MRPVGLPEKIPFLYLSKVSTFSNKKNFIHFSTKNSSSDAQWLVQSDEIKLCIPAKRTDASLYQLLQNEITRGHYKWVLIFSWFRIQYY